MNRGPAARPGSVLGWGLNHNGELAVERAQKVEQSPRLVPKFEGKGIIQTASGDGFTLLLSEFGDVYSVGVGRQGELGHGAASEACVEPTRVGGELLSRRVISVVAGHALGAAITADGELFEWGLLHYTPEGDGENASIEMHGLARRRFVSERLLRLVRESTVKYLTTPEEDRVARREDALALAAASAAGEDGAAASDPGPDAVPQGEAARTHTNTNGTRGDEGVVNLRTRRKVHALPQLCQSLQSVVVSTVALGAAHTAVLSREGHMYTKGYNDRGQLGAGHRVSRADFERVVGDVNDLVLVDVVCGSAHCLTLTSCGQVWVCGTNAFGQLGLGPKKGEQLKLTRMDLLAGDEIAQVAAGDHHSVCLTREGEVLSFGHAEYGQHGGNASGSGDLQFAHMLCYFHTPRPVAPFSFRARGDEGRLPDADSGLAAQERLAAFIPVRSIASTARYTLAVDTDGQLWSWGWNGSSVLGHGPGARWTAPNVVEALAGVQVNSVAAGQNHVMVIVEPMGSQFALSFAGLLPAAEGVVAKTERGPNFDVVVRSKLGATQAKEKDAELKYSVMAHRFVVLSRCPRLEALLRPVEGEPVGFEIRLPYVLAPKVLFSLIEYLYCDHIRSCPPHRLVDLEQLAGQLGLPHLASVCAFSRYQRALKRQIGSMEGPRAGSKRHAPHIVASTFSVDMKRAVERLEFHDIFLAAAEEDEDDDNYDDNEEEDAPDGDDLVARAPCPPGHTAFSWYGSGGLERLPPGHTAFSAPLARPREQLASSAHLEVLCRYPFFDKLLNGAFKEGRAAQDPAHPVMLHNLTPRGLSRLIHWMYRGDRSAALDPDTVMSVLATARCFGVDDLAHVCELFLLTSISPDNAHYIAEFARDENNARLLRRCEQVLAALA